MTRAQQITAETPSGVIEQFSLHSIHKAQPTTDKLVVGSHLDDFKCLRQPVGYAFMHTPATHRFVGTTLVPVHQEEIIINFLSFDAVMLYRKKYYKYRELFPKFPLLTPGLTAYRRQRESGTRVAAPHGVWRHRVSARTG